MLRTTPLPGLKEALDLWIDLTGSPPRDDGEPIPAGEYDVQRIHRELREAQDLDPSMSLVMLMLDAHLEEYLNNIPLTMLEVLENPDVMEMVAKARKLKQVLNSPEVEEFRQSFREHILRSLAHYGIDNPKTLDRVNKGDTLAFLWRDALRGVKELQKHQFIQGAADDRKPKYHKEIYEFWNVNSILQAISSTDYSGVALILVRDTQVTSYSYFVFAIRNGGTITILTDKPEAEYPRQKFRIRSAGQARRFDDRRFRFHFPYELMNLCETTKGMEVPKGPEQTNSLVRQQQKFVALAQVKDLPPDQAIWTVLMFEKITEMFWHQNLMLPELSYTGEMIKNPGSLENGPAKDLIQVSPYTPFELPEVTLDDISTERVDDQELFHDEWGHGRNEWAFLRYQDRIQKEIINVVGPPESKVLRYQVGSTELSKPMRLSVVDATDFGPVAYIKRLQHWTARYNAAQCVKACLIHEIEETKDELLDFVFQNVWRNKDRLLEYAVRGELIADGEAFRRRSFGSELKPKNIVNRLINDSDPYRLSNWHRRLTLFSGKMDRAPYVKCIHNGCAAHLRFVFLVQSADAIAKVCGVQKSDLPDLLQHYDRSDPYPGNSILDNVDPMDWVVPLIWREDPRWNLNVSLMLSKSAYVSLRSEWGLPVDRFWREDE